MLQKLRKVLIPLAIIGLLIFLGFSLTQKPQAPNINFVTLEGKTIPMSSLQGKMVLVNFRLIIERCDQRLRFYPISH